MQLKHKGIAIVWVAVLLIVFIGFMGLVIDAARVYITGHQLHNAADAAALAGARWVPDPDSSPLGYNARQKAVEYAAKNYAAQRPVWINENGSFDGQIDFKNSANIRAILNSGGGVYIGRYIDHSRILYADDDTPDSMLVVVQKKDGNPNGTLPLMFGPIFQVNNIGIQKYAVAKVDDAYGAGLHSITDLEFKGQPIVDVQNGGAIRVGYNVLMSGNADPLIIAERMYIGEDLDDKYVPPPTLDVQTQLDTTHTDVRFMDPYRLNGPEALIEPTIPPSYLPVSPTSPASSRTVTLKPGYYPNGFNFKGGDNITLESGIYQLGGAGLQISGSAKLNATSGVMFHIVDTGKVLISTSETGMVNIKGLPVSDGRVIAIFQSRTDTAPAEIQGTGYLNINGEIYFPNNHLEISGSGNGFGTRLIAYSILINGKGSNDAITINFAGRPKIAEKSYLVE